ncbi:MAG: PD40 domain-containing protein [candidate division Zixibacteria bacterium]|nr:PD40 domain-containing protein [candidate division Zixibacteria bacterium]
MAGQSHDQQDSETGTPVWLWAALASIVVAVLALGYVGAGAQSVGNSPAGSILSPGDAARAAAGSEVGWGTMTPQRRLQAISYSRTQDILYFVNVGWGIAIWLILLFTGWSGRLLEWSERIGHRRLFTLFLYMLVLILAVQLTSLPLDYYSGFHLEHQYGLSSQSLGAWFLQLIKGLAVALILLSIAAAIVYALIRRRPQTWWAWVGLVSVPFVTFLIVLAPIVIMPLFYETKPMAESPLRSQILDLAGRSGIPDSRVFVMNASKDTKKINAFVTGLGRTKRIVLFDNTIAALTPGEILFIVGHEMGHYLLHHVWIGLGLIVALIFLFGFLGHLLMARLINRYKARWGFDRLSSFASAPLIALCVSVFSFAFSPIENGLWRQFEHRADQFGLEQTGNGPVAASAFEKMADVNLSNPNPSTFIKFWLYDHPTLSERVRFARSYSPGAAADSVTLRLPEERHLARVRQLTFGGENAEAYFSADGKQLIFQSTRDDWPCDRIFTMNIDGSNVQQVSTGRGATTCSFFSPKGNRIIYCSTHLAGDSCPPRASHARGYIWGLHKGFDVFSARLDGTDLVRLTETPGYDAEAVFSPDGSKILFTSIREGDLELYTMNADGSNPVRLTHELGYDGGAFFSPDGKKIVYRAYHPIDSAAIADYKTLLAEGLIRPTTLEIFVLNADGTGKTQVTHNGAANFCPYFHPDGKRIIFASNMADPKGRNFDLYLINVDGTGLERVTYNDTFDGFPMFNADATKLVFASNRHDAKRGETNIFIADWVE